MTTRPNNLTLCCCWASLCSEHSVAGKMSRHTHARCNSKVTLCSLPFLKSDSIACIYQEVIQGTWVLKAQTQRKTFLGPMIVTKIIGSARSSLCHGAPLEIEQANFWIFTQPNATVSQQVLQITTTWSMQLRTTQCNSRNNKNQTNNSGEVENVTMNR